MLVVLYTFQEKNALLNLNYVYLFFRFHVILIQAETGRAILLLTAAGRRSAAPVISADHPKKEGF
jgi:hypothetical protein